MGVVVHGVADDAGDAVEPPVVHLAEAVQDAPLDGLEAVVDVGDGAVLDDVGGILEEVVAPLLRELVLLGRGGLLMGGLQAGCLLGVVPVLVVLIAHGWLSSCAHNRLAMMKSRRSGELSPM